MIETTILICLGLVVSGALLGYAIALVTTANDAYDSGYNRGYIDGVHDMLTDEPDSQTSTMSTPSTPSTPTGAQASRLPTRSEANGSADKPLPGRLIA